MRTLTALTVLALAGAASADFLLPTVAGPVAAAGNGDYTVNLGTAPAATYVGADITFDFIGTGGSFANELRLGFGSSGVGGTFGNYGFTGVATAIPGASGGGNATYSWSVDFNGSDYLGGSDIFFNGFSTFGANWSSANISVNLITAPTLASLSIATLNPGDSTMGDTRNSTNDLTGNAAVSPFAGGGINGGDDVYEIVWGGGDFDATLDILSTTLPLNLPAELDMYLYDSAEPSSSIGFSGQGNSTGDPDTLSLPGLAAGTYYLRVDGLFDSGAYNLSIAPAPGALGLLGLSGLAGLRRRRA